MSKFQMFRVKMGLFGRNISRKSVSEKRHNQCAKKSLLISVDLPSKFFQIRNRGLVVLQSQSAGFEATAHAKMCTSPTHEIVHFALQPWMQHQTATFRPQKKVSNVPRKK